MLAWRLLLHTPEFPDGRSVVLVANDVTHQAGSFGVAEDHFFKKARKSEQDSNWMRDGSFGKFLGLFFMNHRLADACRSRSTLGRGACHESTSPATAVRELAWWKSSCLCSK